MTYCNILQQSRPYQSHTSPCSHGKVSSCRSWARQALALATRLFNGGKKQENYEKKHGKLWKLWENYGDNYGKIIGNYGTSHVLMRIAGYFERCQSFQEHRNTPNVDGLSDVYHDVFLKLTQIVQDWTNPCWSKMERLKISEFLMENGGFTCI